MLCPAGCPLSFEVCVACPAVKELTPAYPRARLSGGGTGWGVGGGGRQTQRGPATEVKTQAGSSPDLIYLGLKRWWWKEGGGGVI